MQRNITYYLVEAELYNEQANQRFHCTLKVPVKYVKDKLYKKLMKECQGTHLHVLSVVPLSEEERVETIKLPEILALNLSTLL